MESNYKRLGNYIQQVDVRNTDLEVDLLLGVSIDKKFIESHANTVGTDFSKYKIVKKGQFAYGPVTSRNGDKISIALLKEDSCLVSSSYTPFEITKPEELNADYLMLLFSNPEFDRYARYNSWGSAREVFSWEDFCDSMLYIPDITEQEQIVRQYKTITDRINVLEKINEQVCKMAMLEIDNANHTESNQMLIKDYCVNTSSGGTPSRSHAEYYGGNINWLKSGEIHNNVIVDVEEKITNAGLKNSSAKIFPKDTVLMAMYGVTAGQVGYLNVESTTNQAVCAMFCKNTFDAAFLYFSLLLMQTDMERQATGGAQQNLSQDIIKNNSISIPCNIEELHSEAFMKIIIENSVEITHLIKARTLITMKLR